MRVEVKGNRLKHDKVTFIQGNLVNWFIVYKLDRCSQELNLTFYPKYYLFGAVKKKKNGDSDKYSYPEYGIRLHSQLLFWVPNFDWEKNFVISGVCNSLSVHIDINEKNILVLGKATSQELDDTMKKIS